MRIALGVEYAGTHYHGWQQQFSDLPTIQTRVEQALSRIADAPVQVVCAGRTDKSVHAVGQVVHFDTDAQRRPDAWVWGTNSYLPHDISIRWAKVMPPEFHARFSAMSRRYCYVICNQPIRPSIFRDQVSWHYQPLDVARMQQAADYLPGEHDFSSFRASECQAKSPIRTLHYCRLWRQGNFILLDIKANGFLHHMVRNIVGVLLAVGDGREQPEWVQSVLTACDRRAASVTAPASGLYFIAAEYPLEFELETMPVNLPWFLQGKTG